MNVLKERYNLNPLKVVVVGWLSLLLAYGAYLIEWDSIIRIVFMIMPLTIIGVAALVMAFLWAPMELLRNPKKGLSWFTMIMAGIPPAVTVTYILMWSVISPYAYSSDVDVDGLKIRVGFKADHPTKPEYKRFVHVGMYGILDFGRDAGGIDYVNVYNLDKSIVLQTFWDKIIIINKKTKDASLVSRALNAEEKAAFYGKFNFVTPNVYGFTYKKDDSKFDSMMMSGD